MSSLDSYEEKRDFSKTREPAPAPARREPANLRFVIQKHAARRLHYDLRLELDGVLRSWAVPKGPSLDPREKRLAAQVEDHPIDYGTFEGVIADGNYGAGQVIVWDAGVYSPDEGGVVSFGDREEAEERVRGEIEAGKLSFTLRGRKLRGSWALVRTTRSPQDWLLIKHRDAYANEDRDLVDEDRSVQSGLTLVDLESGRMPARRGPEWLGLVARSEVVKLHGRPAPFPTAPRPMMARTTGRPFSGDEWIFEPKLDGYRIIALVRNGQVTLLSRNGKDMTAKMPEVVEELRAVLENEVVIDGEVVALDQRGFPDFGLLQRSIDADNFVGGKAPGRTQLVYYPFDLLYVTGIDVRKAPLIERKRLLAEVLLPSDRVREVEYVEGDGESFYHAVTGLGLEGMLAKRRDAAYEDGARTAAWLKVKAVQEQDLVVAGYVEGEGVRASTFGSLVLGYYEDGVLRYTGRVGSGFDDAALASLSAALSSLETDACPFTEPPEPEGPKTRWVRPDLVVRVKFAQWTDDGRLRAAVYLGLRSDVEAVEVRRDETHISPAPVSARRPAERGKTAASDDVGKVLEQLSEKGEKLLLVVGEHKIAVTNLDKPLWPAETDRPPITKRNMIRYYTRMAPFVLPHLRDRPLTLTRYPNGIRGQSFYQKHFDQGVPEFVETVRLFSSHNEGDVEYVMINNLPTLLWLAQLADIELHPWQSRVILEPDARELPTTFAGSEDAIRESVLNYPDFIVFDLDPYIYSGDEKEGAEPELNRDAFAKTCEVALALKDILDQLSLSSFLKTSGKTGLHVYVPVVRQYDYKTTRRTCEIVGRFLMRHRPRDVTMEWTVGKRTGRIFLDHNQNVRGKNMASVYSLRPLPRAPVSTPLRWDELGSVYPTDFGIDTVPVRVGEIGDLWSDVTKSKHDLRRLLDMIE